MNDAYRAPIIAPPAGLNVSPPNWQRCGATYVALDGPGIGDFTTAGTVLRSVDDKSRRRRGLYTQVERELLRSCCLHNVTVRIGIRDKGLPLFYVPKIIADHWLNEGGRAWIIAEIETRAGRDVIAFQKPLGRRG